MAFRWLPNIADVFFSLARLIEDSERQLNSASYDSLEFLVRSLEDGWEQLSYFPAEGYLVPILFHFPCINIHVFVDTEHLHFSSRYSLPRRVGKNTNILEVRWRFDNVAIAATRTISSIRLKAPRRRSWNLPAHSRLSGRTIVLSAWESSSQVTTRRLLQNWWIWCWQARYLKAPVQFLHFGLVGKVLASFAARRCSWVCRLYVA